MTALLLILILITLLGAWPIVGNAALVLAGLGVAVLLIMGAIGLVTWAYTGIVKVLPAPTEPEQPPLTEKKKANLNFRLKQILVFSIVYLSLFFAVAFLLT